MAKKKATSEIFLQNLEVKFKSREGLQAPEGLLLVSS
jgi:hypothetical protein